MVADYTLEPVDHDPFAESPQDPEQWAELEQAAAARGMTVQQHLTDLITNQAQRRALAQASPQGTA